MQISTAPRPSGRPDDPMDRRAWHRKASRPVSAWLVGLLVLAFVHRWVPQSRWLLVHMFTLGMVTNSILVWGQHFADALLRTSSGVDERRRQVTRIRVLNLGIVTTCVGMVGEWPSVAVAGAFVVGACLCWYSVSLLRQVHHALPARFSSTVKFYAAAALLLPVGATFGGFMAFSQPESWQGRLLLAHLFTNLGGFVGLTAVGTLVTLWPTVLRTKMSPGQDVAGLRALVVMASAVVVGIVGALTGVQLVSAAAVLGYLAGLVVIGIPLVRCAVRKPPRDYPGYSMGAAQLWFFGVLLALAWRLFTSRRTLVAADFQAFTPALVVGFGAQLLFGAMSYLMPTVMGGGPRRVRAACSDMNRFGALRAASLNAALVVFLASEDSWVLVLTSLIGFVSLASFLPILGTMVRNSVRARKALAAAAEPSTPAAESPTPAAEPVEAPEPSHPSSSPRRRDVIEAAAGLGAVWGAATLGGRLTRGNGSSTAQDVTATGNTTTVEVVATAAMRFDPEIIELPAGDRLVITLRNDDPAMVHDLYLANGASSGRVAPGATKTIDVGVIGATLEGWCTIVGHRAAGMLLHVRPTGTATDAHASHASTGTSTRTRIDLSKAPGKDFRTRDAVLPTPGTGTSIDVDLEVVEAVQEVAPGYTQTAMTYNGHIMGPTIVAHLGDRITAHLANHGTMGHSVDFHAGDVSPDKVMRTIKPGESLDYPFTARRAGIWLYHCSTMPMSSHLAAGMYGAVVVPPKGIGRADREFLLVQQEMYLGPDGGEVDAAKIADEHPDLTVWNGHANQYVFDPLTARVGERVRIWVLAAGPSRGTSFHVVGAQFDTVFKEGAYLLRAGNVEGGGSQALDLGPAQGGFVEMVFTEPGRYTFVNHSFVDAERGARGFIQVS